MAEDQKHLSEEKLLQLSKGSLKGDNLVEALVHIETCDECYNNLPPQSADEVLSIVLGINDEREIEEQQVIEDPTKTTKHDSFSKE